MINSPLNGTRVPYGQKLTGTSNVTLVSASAKRRVTIDSVFISCDATPTSLDLWWTDGTTSFYLLQAGAIPANDFVQIKDLHIPLQREGFALKCKASAANHLDVTVVGIESVATGSAQ